MVYNCCWAKYFKIILLYFNEMVAQNAMGMCVVKVLNLPWSSVRAVVYIDTLVKFHIFFRKPCFPPKVRNIFLVTIQYKYHELYPPVLNIRVAKLAVYIYRKKNRIFGVIKLRFYPFRGEYFYLNASAFLFPS